MLSSLEVKILNKNERKEVYKRYMKGDFPQNELRPLHMIEALVEQGGYYTYGIFVEKQLAAYAYLWEEKDKNILLIDYFAVIPQLRNQGYGMNAMKLIMDVCKEKKGIILETENPERAESEQDQITRKRRIAFYEKCGLTMSSVKILLFGVEYSMMYQNLSGTDVQDEIVDVMQSLYQKTLPKVIYKKMVKFL